MRGTNVFISWRLGRLLRIGAISHLTRSFRLNQRHTWYGVRTSQEGVIWIRVMPIIHGWKLSLTIVFQVLAKVLEIKYFLLFFRWNRAFINLSSAIILIWVIRGCTLNLLIVLYSSIGVINSAEAVVTQGLSKAWVFSRCLLITLRGNDLELQLPIGRFVFVA